MCIQTTHQNTGRLHHHNLVIVVAIYYHVTDNNNKLNFTITVCNGLSVCIQTTHQDTGRLHHHNLVIVVAIYYHVTDNNNKLNFTNYCMQWLICVHSDDTSGHRQIAPSQFSYSCCHILSCN